MPAALTYAVGALEVAFVGAGAFLLWRLVLSPGARASRPPAALLPVNLAGIDVFVFLFFVTTASFLASALAAQLAGLARLNLGGELRRERGGEEARCRHEEEEDEDVDAGEVDR